MKHPNSQERGQAVITVLFVVVVGMLVTTGAIFSLVNAFEASSQQELGALAYQAAESGIEHSMLRLMRDPLYTGETLTVDTNRTAVVTVTSNPNMTIQSVGSAGIVSRKIVATVHYNNLTLVLDSWKETP